MKQEMAVEIARGGEAWETLVAAMRAPMIGDDPYPSLQRLHDFGECLIGEDGIAYVFGYDAITHVLRSPHTYRGGKVEPPDYVQPLTNEQKEEIEEAAGDSAPYIPFLDPPDHTRIRRLVQPVFSPGRIKSFRADVEEALAKALAEIDPTRPVDMTDFAAKLVAEIIGKLVGLSSSRRQEVADLVTVQNLAFDPSVTFEGRLKAWRAKKTHSDYIREVIADRRSNPQDDLVTELVHAKDRSGDLNELELIALIQILYIGGYDTTTHMIGNALVALLRNPSQLELLRNEPTLIKQAVKEFLRFDSSLQAQFGYAGEGLEVGGCALQSGQRVVCLLGAGNRDPRAFSHPERLDILRDQRPGISFGGGIHHCLGTYLAQAELEIVIGELVARFPRMELVADPPLAPAFSFKRFSSVQVLLELGHQCAR